ncbi:hypothetical protein J2Z48_002631 [Croceifilum oryzae]|uniref:Uncharacterized protein n=1 Tax=Croceifilum oryzae TaxID=1553429 RepID=A0AAJ1THA4_9BACL|nr:hypothetical protein [Croceifilum oryzae]MDQ0418439.1 hypothetical protein [Croceifilum oryzae]
MYPSWSELSRFVPVVLLWGGIMDPLFMEFVVGKDYFNLFMILQWAWVVVFGVWSIKLLQKHHNDRKYVRDVFGMTIVAICFYTLILSYETHFSFPSVIPYLIPVVLALIFVAPVKLLKYIGKSK